MEYAAPPHVGGNLSSARRRAATFLDNLPDEDSHLTIGRQNWIAKWTKIGDDQILLGDLNIKKGAYEQATEAWLCALTAFEIARRLVHKDDSQCEAVSSKIESGVQKFELSLAQKVERVKIVGDGHTELLAHYSPSGSRDVPAPVVICVSLEEESASTLLGRLLPVVTGRDVSVLVVSHSDISNHPDGDPQTLLSYCLDYLSVRPDVDAARIGIYGEGSSAALATEFAASDRRLAAAVCDGGLWNWTRSLASVGWMTSAAELVDESLGSARRSQLMRRLRCPVLVVTGGRGLVSVSEAVKLQADCMAANIDLDLATPRMIRSSGGHIENFVTSDDYIFGWLQQKLAYITAS